MSVVIDANIWVSSVKSNESAYEETRQFLSRVIERETQVFCPTLVLPECVAAIIRTTGNSRLADNMVREIEAFPNLMLVPLTVEYSRHAARIARDCRLRGADSVYVAVAEQTGSTLITLDLEVVNRSAPVVRAVAPNAWA
jgi:predicted nucleic acid-binding protein